VETIRRNLAASVTAEVLWHETALRMVEIGLELVVEFGASSVLAPLFRRIPGAPKVLHAGDHAGIAKLRAAIEGEAA
jgi:malonyl CoA-acyl carrier protein transacylase